MLSPKEPNFLAENQSVVSLVSHLHSYFKNTYSQFEIEQSAAISRVHAASEATEKQRLQEELQQIEVELTLFGALSDALSIADRLLHAKSATSELGLNSEVYTMHHDPET